MGNRDRKVAFRIVGTLLLIVGVLCRSDPRMVLPNSMAWSGDFWASEYGVRLTAFADLMNLVVLVGSLLLVFSFTTLTDEPHK